ncbi:MAG: hypothetical protein ACXW52_23910 [Candidatus Binatia bacterium]
MKGLPKRPRQVAQTHEEKKAERLILDGMADLLVELGLVKRKGKQQFDSTHIVG